MPASPDQQWRQLTALYAQMWDDELLNLAAGYNDLTDMAKQVLRDEIRKRNLGDPSAPAVQPQGDSTTISSTPRKIYDILASPVVPYVVPDGGAAIPAVPGQGDDDQHEYTWKIRLCDCDDLLQAQQLSEVLAKAGIESWIEAMSGYAIGVGSPRVLVPADQLEEARLVAAQPIPQDIIDESKIETPEYQLLYCPRCRNQEPTLIGTEPSNQWLCETCGNEWTEPVAQPKQL
jgi:hypothetical protein